MRWGACIILTVLMAGCCCNGGKKQHEQHSAPAPATNQAQALEYEPALSTALVFDPPVAAGQPRLDLDREARSPVAVVGYDELETTYFYLRIDDRQTFQPIIDGNGTRGNLGRFERRAISETVGVRYR